jgi:hypothetical protein
MVVALLRGGTEICVAVFFVSKDFDQHHQLELIHPRWWSRVLHRPFAAKGHLSKGRLPTPIRFSLQQTPLHVGCLCPEVFLRIPVLPRFHLFFYHRSAVIVRYADTRVR